MICFFKKSAVKFEQKILMLFFFQARKLIRDANKNAEHSNACMLPQLFPSLKAAYEEEEGILLHLRKIIFQRPSSLA